MTRLEPQFLGAVFDGVDAGLIVLDPAGRVLGWNAWMAVGSGVSADAAFGHRLDEIFPTLLGTRLIAAITEAVTGGVSSLLTHSLHSGLLPLKTRAGQDLIQNVTVRPIGAEPALCLIQITDVTVATERDSILRKRQNARYDAVVESAPNAILTLDASGMVQTANPAVAREFGYAAKELLGQPIDVLFDGQPAWAEAWTTLLSGAPLARPVELIARRKDGSSSFLEVSAARWRSDTRTFVTAILRDVNERRAAEEALRRLNQTLERRVAERTADRDRMWRLSTDVMLVARLDGTIQSTNPAWKHILGWDEATLIHAPLAAFVMLEDRPRLQAALHDMARSRTPRLFELRLRKHDGGNRHIAWSAVADGDLLQAVGRDVTAEREAQAALLTAEEALRQSQKMEALGQLTGGIAHDFNNLLTGIIGAMDIVKRRITAGRYEDVERFMDAASASAHRAAALTHRLLAFARRQPLDPQSVDINHLIGGIEELLLRSVGEQVVVEFRLPPGLWPAMTDANQLENALLNLAINGRDAMPHGGRLTIATENLVLEEADHGSATAIAAGEYTLISVSDTGVGMTRETLAKVFDPFFTTKPIGQGTGLGLSMIYGFVMQSNGHVRIESTVGQGTTVRLYLPRHHGASVQRPPQIVAKPIPKGSGETVLVVEDDPSVRLLVSEVLRELGYTSLEAADGQAALPVLTSNARLDLMVTDVGLPGLNGRQLAEIARQHRPKLKILFVTGYAEHALERGTFLGEGMEMVTKPFALDALASKIRDMIAAAP
ncbi:PAS domain-containing hybrid sensor histidine kinase/response regulator [Acidisoma cladoniae]|jgi:PAS domain S-box-containing protein|uniref:PAS domain-containing hybrid sensor histidine kinase/response regulator n=1 Tax=Acidisoma cladoniae TaxID=3040935 RepID=UPI00254B5974|nr:PAS domain S-box protein [Acidisoma sp. PAMC 29798]